MGIMTAIEVGASGLAAQRKRMEVHMSNLAIANITRPAGEEPLRPKKVLFEATSPESSFGSVLEDAVQGVKITKIVTDSGDPEPKYEPKHPHADKNGFVLYPKVNTMLEMADMLNATRSYEADLQAVTMAKDMLQKTLEILR
jgi:flagellar basal-body rod protein FlgC